jgi:hypothetical protein
MDKSRFAGHTPTPWKFDSSINVVNHKVGDDWHFLADIQYARDGPLFAAAPALLERVEELEAAAKTAFTALATDNIYSEKSDHAWRILGEVLDVVHSDQLKKSDDRARVEEEASDG